MLSKVYDIKAKIQRKKMDEYSLLLNSVVDLKYENFEGTKLLKFLCKQWKIEVKTLEGLLKSFW